MTPTAAAVTVDPIRIALPSKGHLYDGIVALLKSSGYRVSRASDRQYEAAIKGHPRFHVVFMRPGDIVEQVEEGRCHLGVTGFDVFAERASESPGTVVVDRDLGYGGCRLVVAVPESWVDVTEMIDLADLTSEFKASGRSFRVSTKYPNLTRDHFRAWGIYHYQLIHSDGALELHPTLGIADLIVDLTSSGTTLRDNRLREIGGGIVTESAACLIGHRSSLAAILAEGPTGPLAALLDAIDGVRASDDALHLEVVGDLASSDRSAGLVAAFLAARGARQVVRGDVILDQDTPAWRVTALIDAGRFPAIRRPLLGLGASRIVGLPARFVFDRDAPSTYDRLASGLSVEP